MLKPNKVFILEKSNHWIPGHHAFIPSRQNTNHPKNTWNMELNHLYSFDSTGKVIKKNGNWVWYFENMLCMMILLNHWHWVSCSFRVNNLESRLATNVCDASSRTSLVHKKISWHVVSGTKCWCCEVTNIKIQMEVIFPRWNKTSLKTTVPQYLRFTKTVWLTFQTKAAISTSLHGITCTILQHKKSTNPNKIPGSVKSQMCSSLVGPSCQDQHISNSDGPGCKN